MSTRSTDEGDASLATEEVLERLVQRFEKQWSDSQRGRLPKIEDFLPLVPADQRGDLLTKLLSIELPARSMQRNADLPTVSEYVSRFPHHEVVIQQAFDDWPLDNYVLMAKIGEGGMGKVYKARRCVMHDLVAVKVMADVMLDSVPDGVSKFERFQREIRTVAQLVHPNIVRALDARRLRDGQLILVMELVDGISLGKLAAHEPLPVAAACEAVRQAAQALDFAHTQGVIHRDVKSENLMATWDGTVKLLDLGLAKVKAGNTGQTAVTGSIGLLGTPEFMAPEQWESASDVDPRVDVYALGCVLFHLLAGATPWRRGQFAGNSNVDFFEMQAVICKGPTRRVDELRSDCPAELVELVAQAMHRDRTQRIPTAAALAAALSRWSDCGTLREYLWLRRVDRSAVTQAVDTAVRKLDATAPAIRDEVPLVVAQAPVALTATVPDEPSRAGRRRVSRRSLLLGAGAAGGFGLLGLAWWSSRPDVAALRARCEVATLPGLHGEWWFVEMPWYTPAVRQELANQISRADVLKLEQDLLQADTKQSDVLRQSVHSRTEQLLESLSDDVQRSFSQFWLYVNAKNLSPQQATDKYLSTLAALEAKPETERLAADWHLGGILLHRLANLGHAKGDFVSARQWYGSAKQAYKRDASDLLWLVDADLGMLWTDSSNYAEAVSQYRSALRTESDRRPQCLQVWLHARASAAYGRVPDLEEGLNQARAAETAAAALGPQHPLAAYAWETLGWRYVDSLRFPEAAKCFEKALSARPGDQAEALSYHLHDKHGLALCDYFQGKVTEAIEELTTLVEGDIPKALQPGPGSLRGADRELVQRRWPNSWERLADCYLFGRQECQPAARAYDEAMKRGRDLGWDKGGNSVESYASLWYRRLIAEASSPAASGEAATKQWNDLQQWTATAFGQQRDVEQFKRLEVRREAAQAIVKTFDPATRSAATEQLRMLITDRKKGRDEQQRLLRDDLGILLLAVETWFEFAGESMQPDQGSAVVEILDGLLALHEEAVRSSPDLTWFFGHCFHKVRNRLESMPMLTQNSELRKRYVQLVEASNRRS